MGYDELKLIQASCDVFLLSTFESNSYGYLPWIARKSLGPWPFYGYCAMLKQINVITVKNNDHYLQLKGKRSV